MVSAPDPVEGGSGGVVSLQEWVSKPDPYMDMHGNYMGTYNVLREVLGSDLECGYYEDKKCSVYVKNPLSNSLRPLEVLYCVLTLL